MRTMYILTICIHTYYILFTQTAHHVLPTHIIYGIIFMGDKYATFEELLTSILIMAISNMLFLIMVCH